MTAAKHGGYASESERKMLEPRDGGPNEALDDFELSLDLPDRVRRIEVGQIRSDIWQVVMVGARGTRRTGGRYNTEKAANIAGSHLVGLVMR